MGIVELLEKAKAAIARGDDALQKAAEYIAEAVERGATQEQVAKELSRSQQWVSQLLAWRKGGFKGGAFDQSNKSRGTFTSPTSKSSETKPPARRNESRRKNEKDKERMAASFVLDDGMPYKQAASAAGIEGSEQVLKTAVAREEGRREGAAEAQVNPSTLSASAQDKLAAALRQQKREQDRTFEERVRRAAVKMVEDKLLPQYNQTWGDAQEIIKSRRSVLTAAQFNLLAKVCHPDQKPDAETKHRAMQLLNEKKIVLLGEKDAPTASTRKFPRTLDELNKWASG